MPIKRIALYLLVVPPIITFIAGVYGAIRLRTDPSFSQHLPTWTFYLLTGIGLSLLLEVVVRRFAAESDLAERVEAVIERVAASYTAGLETVPEDEDRIVSFVNLTTNATDAVAVLGIAFSNVSSSRGLAELRELTARVGLRILLPDPQHLRSCTEYKQVLEKSLDRRSDISLEIEGALREFEKLSSALPSRRRSRFEVRLHQAVPTMNLKMVDPDRPTGRMLVEFIPYRCAFQGRLRLRLSPTRGQRGWYDQLRQSFEDLWKDATPVLPKPAPESNP